MMTVIVKCAICEETVTDEIITLIDITGAISFLLVLAGMETSLVMETDTLNTGVQSVLNTGGILNTGTGILNTGGVDKVSYNVGGSINYYC